MSTEGHFCDDCGCGIEHGCVCGNDCMTVELNPDGSYPEICRTCGVDHRWTMADLSHANIALMLHAQERFTWMEWPINGDMIARQRAGILDNSLLYSFTDPEEIDWDYIHPREVIAVHEGYGEEAWCPNCREHWPCRSMAAITADGGD